MKYGIIKAIALLLILSFLASCASRRTPWRRHRFNAHSNRGEGKYWYSRGA